tara:strand:- start:3356 stop:4042 length:687 start_codon:yes stop_codon:yes gene_type:complete
MFQATAEQLGAAQQTPTDWSKFEGTLMTPLPGQPGGLPSGMGPGFDDKLHVRFFMRPRIDPEESAKKNRPIYKDVPHIEIMIPGDKNNIVTAEVWSQHIQRFPTHWAQFQAGIKDQVVGTPLRVAPFLTEAQVEELAYFKIRTIEQLAEMPDSGVTFMGARELKNAAVRYLSKTNSAEVLLQRITDLEAKLSSYEVEQSDDGAPARTRVPVKYAPPKGKRLTVPQDPA